jgi:phage terminase large subunit-like protein
MRRGDRGWFAGTVGWIRELAPSWVHTELTKERRYSRLKRIHIIAPTTADLHDVMLEGPAGLLRPRGNSPVPRFLTYKRRLE